MAAHLNLAKLRHHLRYHANTATPVVIDVTEEAAKKGMQVTHSRDGRVSVSLQDSKSALENVQRLLSLRPSALERTCIAWGIQALSAYRGQEFNKPEEKTSTLAVTSPSGWFVDIRFDLVPRVGELEPCSTHRDLTFWAFAGTVISDPVQSIPSAAHAKWTHDIDTSLETLPDKNSDQDSLDEGDLFLLHGGTLIEVGSMHSPELGRKATYKEHWQPIDLTEGPLESVVVKVDNVERNTRGLIVRTGAFCQGLIHDVSRKVIAAERWCLNVQGEWDRKDQFAEEISSKTKAGNRSNILPCRWACEKRVLGDKAEVDGLGWEVIEVKAGDEFLEKSR